MPSLQKTERSRKNISSQQGRPYKTFTFLNFVLKIKPCVVFLYDIGLFVYEESIMDKNLTCATITGANAGALQTAINTWLGQNNNAGTEVDIRHITMSESAAGVLTVVILYVPETVML
jgi:hypothetical protein